MRLRISNALRSPSKYWYCSISSRRVADASILIPRSVVIVLQSSSLRDPKQALTHKLLKARESALGTSRARIHGAQYLSSLVFGRESSSRSVKSGHHLKGSRACKQRNSDHHNLAPPFLETLIVPVVSRHQGYHHKLSK